MFPVDLLLACFGALHPGRLRSVGGFFGGDDAGHASNVRSGLIGRNGKSDNTSTQEVR